MALNFRSNLFDFSSYFHVLSQICSFESTREHTIGYILKNRKIYQFHVTVRCIKCMLVDNLKESRFQLRNTSITDRYVCVAIRSRTQLLAVFHILLIFANLFQTVFVQNEFALFVTLHLKSRGINTKYGTKFNSMAA